MPNSSSKKEKTNEFVTRAYVDEGLSEIIPKFIDNRSRDVQVLQRALDSQDFNTIEKVGHRLKGDCGSYGFDLLSYYGENLEQAAQRGAIATIRAFIERIKRHLENVEVVYRREKTMPAY